MDDYTAAADKLRHEVKHLDAAMRGDNIQLTVSIAKRCRRHCDNLVRALARHRDQLQPDKEGTSE
jgi:hypothetical protein